MDILYLLIPLSVVLVFLIAAVFWFALHHGQFDDLEGPALMIIADDDATEGLCLNRSRSHGRSAYGSSQDV